MSAVFIFEIKDAKKDKVFSFLKGRFFVIGAPMDMIFDLFSDIYARLRNFFQDIAKIILI